MSIIQQKEKQYMLEEILEQPASIIHALSQDSDDILSISKSIMKTKNIILTACGTSHHAALIGRHLFSKISGKLSEVIISSELEYFDYSIDSDTLIIALSQSGETDDVLQGIKHAKKDGANIIAIVNKPGSTLEQISDKTIHLNCGPEMALTATKSFMAQLTILYLLAFAAAGKLEIGIKDLKSVSRAMKLYLNKNRITVAKLTDMINNKRRCYFIARGVNSAIASEGALKLKEVSGIHAEGMPAGELKHGTLALIEEGTPVVVICPADYTYDHTMNSTIETAARGAMIIGVSDKKNPVFDTWIKIPPVKEIFYPMVSVIPIQLLAYELAVHKGLDADRPKNLVDFVRFDANNNKAGRVSNL